jgi:hypothetical protein
MTIPKHTVTVLRYGAHGRAFDESDLHHISLPAPPWADDQQPAEHQRPTEPPMYARRATFGASGATQPDWRK